MPADAMPNESFTLLVDQFGDEYIPVVLFIGLNGSHHLTGQMAGEEIIDDLVRQPPSLKHRITSAWGNSADDTKQQKLRKWFKPNESKASSAALTAISKLVKHRQLRLQYIVTADPEKALSSLLQQEGALRAKAVVELIELQRAAIDTKLKEFESRREPALIDVGEAGIWGIEADRFGKYIDDDLLGIVGHLCEGKIAVCWGWSKWNRDLEDFLKRDNYDVFALGVDSQTDRLTGRGRKVHIVSASEDPGNGGLLPTDAILIELAAEIVKSDGALPSERMTVRSAVAETDEVSNLRIDDLLWDKASFDEILNGDPLVTIAGVDGRDLRGRFGAILRNRLEQPGFLHAFVHRVSTLAAMRAYAFESPMISESLVWVILCEEEVTTSVPADVAILNAWLLRARSTGSRMIALACTRHIEHLTRPDLGLSKDIRPFWRRARSTLAAGNFKALFNRIGMLGDPDAREKWSELSEKMSLHAQTVTNGDGADQAVDRVHIALRLWIEKLHVGGSPTATDIPDLLKDWCALLPPPRTEETVDLRLRRRPQIPSDEPPATKAGAPPDDVPELKLRKRTERDAPLGEAEESQ